MKLVCMYTSNACLLLGMGKFSLGEISNQVRRHPTRQSIHTHYCIEGLFIKSSRALYFSLTLHIIVIIIFGI